MEVYQYRVIVKVDGLLISLKQRKAGTSLMHWSEVIVSDASPANHFHAKAISDSTFSSLQLARDRKSFYATVWVKYLRKSLGETGFLHQKHRLLATCSL